MCQARGRSRSVWWVRRRDFAACRRRRLPSAEFRSGCATESMATLRRATRQAPRDWRARSSNACAIRPNSRGSGRRAGIVDALQSRRAYRCLGGDLSGVIRRKRGTPRRRRLRKLAPTPIMAAQHPRRLLTIAHSYCVALNRRLAHEMARAGGEQWEVTAVAPRFFHGDLRPIPLEPQPGGLPRGRRRGRSRPYPAALLLWPRLAIR